MPTGHLTVAIVEDDDLIAMALAVMLAQVGATVVAAAHTYAAALTMFENGLSCDVLFIDLWLHGRDSGLDIARQAARNGISVVIMTGESSLPEDLPGSAFLSKPFSLEQVRAVLHGLRRVDPLPGPHGPV